MFKIQFPVFPAPFIKLGLSLLIVVFINQTVFCQAPIAKAKSNTKDKLNNSNYKKLDYVHAEIAYHGWANIPDSVKTKWYNRSFHAYGTYPFPLGKSAFSFVVGAGIAVDNLYSNSQIYNDSLGTVLRPITTAHKINKLTTAYAEAPLMLAYKSKADKYGKSMKFSAGFKFGYLLSVHTKFKSTAVAGVTQKVKLYSAPGISKYRYQAAITAGYDWIYLTANYSLNPYFSVGKGLKVNPFTIGIGFVGF
jgi:hypothetical protein